MDRRVVLGIVGLGAIAAGTVAVIAVQRRRESLGRPKKLLGRSRIPKPIESAKGLKHYRSSMPIQERVGILQDLTYKSVQDPEMRKLALGITRGSPERDGEAEARAIYGWMRDHVRYSGDIGPHKLGRKGPVEGIDLFQSAARTVEFGAGDCDDHAILACTLALHNGLACKYRVTSPSRRGEEYSHIYAMVGLPKNRPSKWIAMDTTLERGRFGTEAPFGRSLDFVA